jgi:S-adenosylmethionine decarboxylase proenzyme
MTMNGSLAAMDADGASFEEVYPAPHFEGAEKRIEIDFHFNAGNSAGLRALTRGQLDECMTAAQCEIVSARRNSKFDAYVLSESSLFVFPTKLVLKTCGTTHLLAGVPSILKHAAAVGLEPRRVKYTRSSFDKPELQPKLHASFDHETEFLEKHFGNLGRGGSAYILGSKLKGVQWHVYVSGDACPVQDSKPKASLEVCMTRLNRAHCDKHFYRNENFVSSAQTTTDSGIRSIFEQFDIDDYVFDPCGYSMNALREDEFATIHITPEDGFSYASCELSNVDVDGLDAFAYVRKVASVFKPGKMVFAISIDGLNAADASDEVLAHGAFVPGYARVQSTRQEFDVEGCIAYYTYERNDRFQNDRFHSAISVPDMSAMNLKSSRTFSCEFSRPLTPQLVMDFPCSNSNSEESSDGDN